MADKERALLDRIVIEDLRLRTIVGVSPEERQQQQEVIVRIEMFADLRAAAAVDDINRTVDYKKVKKEVMAYVEQNSCCLVETLTSGIASICLSSEHVQKVRVRVDKPGALRFARSVAVEIERTSETLEPEERG